MLERCLNNTTKESTNTPNKSPKDESPATLCDSDIATSTLVCSSSLLSQISNLTRSEAWANLNVEREPLSGTYSLAHEKLINSLEQ